MTYIIVIIYRKPHFVSTYNQLLTKYRFPFKIWRVLLLNHLALLKDGYLKKRLSKGAKTCHLLEVWVQKTILLLLKIIISC